MHGVWGCTSPYTILFWGYASPCTILFWGCASPYTILFWGCASPCTILFWGFTSPYTILFWGCTFPDTILFWCCASPYTILFGGCASPCTILFWRLFLSLYIVINLQQLVIINRLSHELSSGSFQTNFVKSHSYAILLCYLTWRQSKHPSVCCREHHFTRMMNSF